MRIAASVFLLFLTLGATAGAQSPAVRVFLTDNLTSMTDNLTLAVREDGGWGVADGWGIAEWAFREFADRDECQGLTVTSQPWRAHFTISIPRNLGQGGDAGLDFDFSGGNPVAVLDGWGDMLYAGSTIQFENALKDACEAIDRHVMGGADLITIGEAGGR